MVASFIALREGFIARGGLYLQVFNGGCHGDLQVSLSFCSSMYTTLILIWRLLVIHLTSQTSINTQNTLCSAVMSFFWHSKLWIWEFISNKKLLLFKISFQLNLNHLNWVTKQKAIFKISSCPTWLLIRDVIKLLIFLSEGDWYGLSWRMENIIGLHSSLYYSLGLAKNCNSVCLRLLKSPN